MNNSPKNVNGGARTAAYRICAVASYDNISPKADHGDIFIRAVTGQMGALSRILLKIKSESDIHPSMVMHTWILCSPFNPHREYTHTWSSGQSFMLRHPGSSWGFDALLKGTSVVVLKVENVLGIHCRHLQLLQIQLSDWFYGLKHSEITQKEN